MDGKHVGFGEVPVRRAVEELDIPINAPGPVGLSNKCRCEAAKKEGEDESYHRVNTIADVPTILVLVYIT